MGWDGSGAPEVPPHRSRKDRRRWCGGHKGREHLPEIRLDKYWESQRCRWSMWGIGGRPVDVWAIGGRPVDGEPRYHCFHQEACVECGKILCWRLLPAECPEYRPAPIAFEKLPCKRCGCLLGEHVRGDCACRIHATCTRFFWEDV